MDNSILIAIFLVCCIPLSGPLGVGLISFIVFRKDKLKRMIVFLVFKYLLAYCIFFSLYWGSFVQAELVYRSFLSVLPGAVIAAVVLSFFKDLIKTNKLARLIFTADVFYWFISSFSYIFLETINKQDTALFSLWIFSSLYSLAMFIICLSPRATIETGT